MPKKPMMQDAIYKYLLEYFERRYKEKQANKIKRSRIDEVRFATIESIVDFVFENDMFYDTENWKEGQRVGQVKVSKGTVRKAIKRLITEDKIAISQGSYEFVPHMEDSLEKHPVLDIATKIDVSIGVPDETVVLSVAPEYAMSITNYLSAFFYHGDVLFIPIMGKILCMSVYPKSVLDAPNDAEALPNKQLGLRQRIELALHSFNCNYPDFPYGESYELAYHISHNPDMINAVNNMFKVAGDNGMNQDSIRIVREAAFWMAEQLDSNPQFWAHMKAELEDEDEDEAEDETGIHSEQEMSFWDFCNDDGLTDQN